MSTESGNLDESAHIIFTYIFELVLIFNFCHSHFKFKIFKSKNYITMLQNPFSHVMTGTWGTSTMDI